jgi:hypothetical protein
VEDPKGPVDPEGILKDLRSLKDFLVPVRVRRPERSSGRLEKSERLLSLVISAAYLKLETRRVGETRRVSKWRTEGPVDPEGILNGLKKSERLLGPLQHERSFASPPITAARSAAQVGICLPVMRPRPHPNNY